MVNLNPELNSALSGAKTATGKAQGQSPVQKQFSDAGKAVGKYLSEVNDIQQSSEQSIKELLTGKNMDITTVVSAAAKADISFKLLVGVRNKLIEAYKQTMNMPL